MYIAFTKVSLPYGWMGNMSPYSVVYEDKKYPTTEALFQALRFTDPNIREELRLEKSPMTCKLKAKSILAKYEKDNTLHLLNAIPLSKQDVDNMELCLRLKLQHYPLLIKELLNTQNLPIYEDVTARGSRGNNLFWGAIFNNGVWTGKNVLGNLWQKLRDEYYWLS